MNAREGTISALEYNYPRSGRCDRSSKKCMLRLNRDGRAASTVKVMFLLLTVAEVAGVTPIIDIYPGICRI